MFVVAARFTRRCRRSVRSHVDVGARSISDVDAGGAALSRCRSHMREIGVRMVEHLAARGGVGRGAIWAVGGPHL